MIDYRTHLSCQDPLWDQLPRDWDEAPFLGNGCMGVQLYQNPDSGALHMEIGRADVQDHRPRSAIPIAYENGRLPIGAFEFAFSQPFTDCRMRLDLYNALLTGSWTAGRQTLSFEAYVHAVRPVFVLSCSSPLSDDLLSFLPARCISPRQLWGHEMNDPRKLHPDYVENPPCTTTVLPDMVLVKQPLLCGGMTVTAYARIQRRDRSFLLCHVAHSEKDHSAEESAIRCLRSIIQEIETDYTAFFRLHTDWWNAYFSRSFLSIPDKKFESFYYIQLYKLASATRADGVLIDNQGPWLQKTAWPYATWNLNVQLTYLPVCRANRPELGLSLVHTLSRNLDNLIENVPPAFRHDSAAIATSATTDCISHVPDPANPTGGEIGDLLWTMHNCWMIYRYTQDLNLLRDEIYPLLRRAVCYMLHFLFEGEDGRLHVAYSGSPEYGNAVDANYNLALIRWGLDTLKQAARLLGTEDPEQARFDHIRETLTDYVYDEAEGYWIGKDTPYRKSHRHYSHLLMVCPLQIVDFEDPVIRRRILRSLDHWFSLDDKLRGYSFTGASSMYAYLGMGDRAIEMLDRLWQDFLRPNTMYRENGPVIETPLAAMDSLQDLLLQCRQDTISVFPAMPSKWKDAAFDRLLAEGGFEVSAIRRDGETRMVRIAAPKGGTCRVSIKMQHPRISTHGQVEGDQTDSGLYTLTFAPGSEITFSSSAAASDCMEPVLSCGNRAHRYGLNQDTAQLLNVDRTDFILP